MNKTLLKDTRRLIGSTKGRFFSLTAIVTIGVAFFVGVSSSSYIMGNSVDAYDDETSMKDITVYSNYGFDSEDVDAVKNLDDVSNAELSQFVDVTAVSGTYSMTTRIHSYNADNQINSFELKSGRLPENENECVVEAGSSLEASFKLGATVTFSRPDNDLSDYLSVTSCTIVGTISTPLYLDEVKENSTLSNQPIETYIYIPESAFTMDYYMEMNVLIKDGKSYDSFSQEYEDYAASVKAEIQDLAETQENHRYDVVVSKAQDEYNDGLADYNQAQQDYTDQINDAQAQIDDSTATLNDGEEQIQSAENTLNDSQNQLDTAYTDGMAEIQSARDTLASSQSTLDQKKADFATQKQDYQSKIDQIDNGITQIDQGVQSLSTAESGINSLQKLQTALSQASSAGQIVSGYQSALGNDATVEQMEAAIQSDTTLSDDQKTERISLIEGVKTSLETVMGWSGSTTTITTLSDYTNAVNYYTSNATQINGTIDTQIQSAYDSLNQGLSLSGTGNEITTIDGIESYSASLENQKTDLQKNRQTIVDGIADGEKQLTDAQSQIDQGYADANDGEAQLKQKITESQQEIDDGWSELNDQKATLEQGRADLNDAIQQLEDAKKDGTQQLEDAKSKLDKAQQDINDLDTGKWTVLDRTEHYSSVAYKNTIHQMEAIAAIFPVFFFMVAALVCLTTMTRMVDEQRGQLGILRALGYSQRQCAYKYLIYAGIATVIGTLLGNVLGMGIFPGVIYNAWKMMYLLPTMQLSIDWPVTIISSVSFFAVMILTTWYACHEDMKEVPSQLMRPKSPKLGKSTFIEKIPFIWKHLSFTWKVTVRNLIRYKKRFVMTVIGVAGCTALLITGFGIRDSIQTIADKQFSEIYQYNGTATFSQDLSASIVDSVYEEYANKDIVSSSTLLTAYSASITCDEVTEDTVYMQVFDSADDISTMYELRNRVSGKSLTLQDDGVIISEKLSENLHKKVGDTITIESKDGVTADVKITGICEMYVRHYVFMTKDYYKEIFGVTTGDNTMALAVSGTSEQSKAMQQEIAESDNFSGVEFYDDLLKNFNSMISGLDIIIVVLIISSASLAGVVLGNLTNVNISERMREIATLKVLGFRRKEVNNYIYKENNVLTFIGSLVGIPLGSFLHYYIMHQVEMDYVMFGRSISGWSYLLCVAMTVGFGILVNLFMTKKLVKIQMVESLKSVE